MAKRQARIRWKGKRYECFYLARCTAERLVLGLRIEEESNLTALRE